MALAPQNQDAFFREVDEEVRRDRTAEFFRRYGRVVVAGVVAALVLLAGWLYWQHRRAEAAGAHGEALSAALADAGGANPAAAAPKLAAIAASGDAGYAAAARVAQAGLAAAKGDTRSAGQGYAAIAADGAMPQPFRDLSLVRQTTLEFETLPPATVVARMLPLAKPGGAWFGSAGELTALAYLKQNKPDDAGRMFASLAQDRQVPETIRARARRIAGMLGVDVPGDAAGAGAR